MRPQHITAENRPDRVPGRVIASASMRPQHITAENPVNAAHPPGDARASMRPQHITAENGMRGGPIGRGAMCFNEAAAYHCGKLLRSRRLTAPCPELQ